ncbi:Permease of the drug/metabolite transporter (DMT) superfamily [Olavius algarvensis associated proteobacterium Delta 3]|nr:Permease of the drug/metabolite transporter (DMT) superfamily [Olavius algarvensis associated proteobacterium Delta 3]
MMNQSEPGVSPGLVLFIGVAAISTGAIFARMADAPALVVAAYRVGLATLVLAPVAMVRSRRELLGLSSRDLWMAALSGFLLAIHFAAWISSLEYTSVANSVVLVNTNPIWVGILAPFLVGETIRRSTRIGIGLSVCGGIVIGIGDIAVGRDALFGDALALVGSVAMALYLLMGRNLRRKLSLTAYVVLCYGSAAVILWGCVLAAGLPVAGFEPQTWACFWGLALVSQVIGHTSFNWALRWLGAGVIAVALLGEPIGATILAYMLFGEGLTWYKVVGGALILSAIYITAVGERNGE